MSEAIQQDQSTPINALQGQRVQMSQQQNNGELVDNVKDTYQQMNSDEEGDISDDMYNRQMMGDVNEHMTQYNEPSQNVPKPPSMTSTLINSLKPSLIVLIIFFCLNINIVIKLIRVLLSRVIGTENSRIELFNLCIRSILAALLFFIINKLV